MLVFDARFRGPQSPVRAMSSHRVTPCLCVPFLLGLSAAPVGNHAAKPRVCPYCEGEIVEVISKREEA